MSDVTTSFNQMYISENYQIFYLSFGKLLQQICPQDTFWNNNNLISTQNTIEEKEKNLFYAFDNTFEIKFSTNK